MLKLLVEDPDRRKYGAQLGEAIEGVDVGQSPDQEETFWELVGRGRGRENYQLPQSGRDRDEMDGAKWKDAMIHAELVR